MNQALTAIEYSKVSPTRDYLQDIAKVMASFQQLFIEPDPNHWHTALELTDSGFKTQIKNLVFDINDGGVLSIDDEHWKLADLTADSLIERLQTWLDQHALGKKIKVPNLANNLNHNQAAAENIIEALTWSEHLFTKIKPMLSIGESSPILLYPHHFDSSMTLFVQENLQYTLGFSIGDQTISEPYFYTTAYPETKVFTNRKINSPAFWQKDGFSGVVLKYNDLINLDAPQALVIKYFQEALGL